MRLGEVRLGEVRCVLVRGGGVVYMCVWLCVTRARVWWGGGAVIDFALPVNPQSHNTECMECSKGWLHPPLAC